MKKLENYFYLKNGPHILVKLKDVKFGIWMDESISWEGYNKEEIVVIPIEDSLDDSQVEATGEGDDTNNDDEENYDNPNDFQNFPFNRFNINNTSIS